MPTARPRITITLTERQHELLRSISESSGQSMSASVCELIETAEPVFERMAATFQRLKQQQDQQRERIKSDLDDMQKTLEPIAAGLLDQLDMFLGNLGQPVSGERSGGTPPPASATGKRKSPPTNRGVTPPPRNPSKPKPGKASGQVRSRSRKGS